MNPYATQPTHAALRFENKKKLNTVETLHLCVQARLSRALLTFLMAPLLKVISLLRRTPFDAGLPSREFLGQWTNPGDVFSVLLILGGDVVLRALAQVAGTGLTPVTLSFGWVAYGVSAVVSAVGENRLMPSPDCECIVINGSSGYVRDNTSWILGRIMRDYEYWMSGEIRARVKEMIEEKYRDDCEKRDKPLDPEVRESSVIRRSQVGLCVSFYRAQDAKKGARSLDKVYLSGFFIAFLQLGIAAIPCGLWGDWSILLITISGILLAFASGSLPQWQKEKWSCRTKNPKTVVLTRGNGTSHAIVISDPDGKGLDLEDLAAGQANVDVSTSLSTRIIVGLFAVLWVALLICASGIKSNTWFLFGIGGIGIIQNILVAGWCRNPKAYGVPLRYERVIGMPKVMEALVEVGKTNPRLACSMRETFFPGGMLRDDEKKIWARFEQEAKRANFGKAARKQNNHIYA